MRVTNNMLSQNMMTNIETAQERMLKLQDQSSTGLGVSKPSDDPSAVQQIIRLRNSIANVEQYISNASEASSYMKTIDGALGNITSQLQRVRELAAEGATETLTKEDRAYLALEVDQIKKQLSLEANTQVGTKYVFAGTATDQELVLADGTINPLASDLELQYAVGNQIAIGVSVNGRELFGDTTENPSGILKTLTDLSQALNDDDTEAIGASLDTIDANLDDVISVRADLGARMNRMTALQGQLDTTSANLQEHLSTIQNVDIESTVINYTSQQNVYQAALSVGAKLIQPSLVDYLN